MTAEGYLNQRRRHPVAMTAALAINIGAVAMLLLAKSGYEPRVPDIIWARHIPLEPPPEPQPSPRQPEARTDNPQVYVPPRPLPLPGEPVDAVEGTEVFPQPEGTGTGEGVTAEPIPTPTPSPTPVLTEAAPLSSAMRDFQPPYPSQLLRMGVEGKAVVRVLIGPDGRVRQVAVIAADDPLFAEAAERQALRKWRFRPATRDGVAVESWKQMTVRFEIRP